MHNLHEFEQVSGKDDHFSGNEDNTTRHIDLAQDAVVNSKTSIKFMNEAALCGHNNTADDDSISYYNRYIFKRITKSNLN